MQSDENQKIYHQIYKLFKSKNYRQLYEIQPQVINEMLMLDNQEDFEDFLQENDSIDERSFWLYYSAIQGDSLMIGGYDEDVTEMVLDFLREKLSDHAFNVIKNHVQQIYVDLGTRDNLEECVQVFNQLLESHGYVIRLYYDETYCAGVYFLCI